MYLREEGGLGGVLAIITTACALVCLVGGLVLGSHINPVIHPSSSEMKGVQARLAPKPVMGPRLKRTSLNLEEFEDSLSDVTRQIQDFLGATVASFAVMYSCARYAVRIEHPLRWYRATRMKNYTKDN